MLLFAPAWTTRYWQAWIYRSIFIGASAHDALAPEESSGTSRAPRYRSESPSHARWRQQAKTPSRETTQPAPGCPVVGGP
jgi:hypothetical protein